MLTWAELEGHLSAKTLMLWDPKREGIRPNGRGLYMLPDVYDALLRRPWPAAQSGETKHRTQARRQSMRAVLERFVTGGVINVEADMTELGSKIPRPEHRGFWEFRSGGPWVETRIFGFFARRGAFVATDFLARDAIDFRAQCAVSRAKWDTLTGGQAFIDSPYPVETQADMDAYLTREDDA